MSITVRDCMTLPSLRMGTVIAGQNGLSGIVSSVTVLEFDLTSDDIFVPNELAITAFYDIRDSVSDQVEAIKAAKRSGVVALVLFYSKMILHGVDQKVIETANRYNLPLILLPGEDMKLKYSDVIHDISEAIFLDARSEDFYVDNTMDRISQMDDRHRSLDTVLGLISEYNRSSVILCSKTQQILGYALWPAGNLVNVEQMLADSASKSSTSHMLSFEFKSKDGTELCLYFVNPFASISRNILSETAQIIQLYTSIWNINLNANSRESLIPLILEDKQETWSEVAEINGILPRNYTSLMFCSGKEDAARIRSCIEEYDPAAITGCYEKSLVSFLTLDLFSIRGQLLIDELEEICKEKIYLLSEKDIVSSAAHRYLQFCETAHITEKLFPLRKICRSDTLRFAVLCHEMQGRESEEAVYYHTLLAPLQNDKGEELLPTLQTYLLDADASVKKTAEQLFIHRNTVKYRLDRVRELLGRDFEQMPLYQDIYLAAALARISARGI